MYVLRNKSGRNYCLEDVVQNVISFYYCVCLLQISCRKYLQQGFWSSREPDVPTLSLGAPALCRNFFPSYFHWFPTCPLELPTCQLLLWCFWKEVGWWKHSYVQPYTILVFFTWVWEGPALFMSIFQDEQIWLFDHRKSDTRWQINSELHQWTTLFPRH